MKGNQERDEKKKKAETSKRWEAGQTPRPMTGQAPEWSNGKGHWGTAHTPNGEAVRRARREVGKPVTRELSQGGECGRNATGGTGKHAKGGKRKGTAGQRKCGSRRRGKRKNRENMRRMRTTDNKRELSHGW
jgi:hypothetical protein